MTGAPRKRGREQEATARIRVWDGPTRIFHWALVIFVVTAYVTRNAFDDPTLYWHRINGYAVLTLLIFRLLWGFVGSSTSRFAAFFPTPASSWRYAIALWRGRRLHYLGHNPLGSILIFAMLLAIAAQACAGLFTSDDTIAQGPLHDHASDAVVRLAGFVHARGFWVIVGLATLHILANLAYQFGLKDRLITAMITGAKPDGAYQDAHAVRLAPVARALACLVGAAGLVAGGVLLAGDSLLR